MALVQFNILFPDRFTVNGQDATSRAITVLRDVGNKALDTTVGILPWYALLIGLSFMTVSRERFVQLMTLSIMTRSSQHMIPVLKQLWDAVTTHFSDGWDKIEPWMKTLATSVLNQQQVSVEDVPKYALEWIKVSSSTEVKNNKVTVVVEPLRTVEVDMHIEKNGSYITTTEGFVTTTTSIFNEKVEHEMGLVDTVREKATIILKRETQNQICDQIVIAKGTYMSQVHAIEDASWTAGRCVQPLNQKYIIKFEDKTYGELMTLLNEYKNIIRQNV